MLTQQNAVRVRVPATSANLGPGFDALGLALDLWNEATLSPAPCDELRARGEGADELRGVTTTLAHDAARRVWARLDLPPSGVRIEMLNRVPFSRGLGSSSAAIVTGLFGANRWAQKNVGRALALAQLLDEATAIEGHPDNVAPALMGGLQVAATRDDGRVLSLAPPVARWPRFVMWVPHIELATSHARGVLAPQVAREDAIFNLSRAALLVAALAIGDFEALREGLRDRLHQDARAALVPDWNWVRQAAGEADALGVTLSGAGPSLLCWCVDEAGAQKLLSALHTAGRSGQAHLLAVSTQGAHERSAC